MDTEGLLWHIPGKWCCLKTATRLLDVYPSTGATIHAPVSGRGNHDVHLETPQHPDSTGFDLPPAAVRGDRAGPIWFPQVNKGAWCEEGGDDGQRSNVGRVDFF